MNGATQPVQRFRAAARATASGIVAFAITVGAPALAEGRYDAPAQCPSREAFQAKVEDSGGTGDFGARSWSVRIQASPRGYSGALELDRESAHPMRRKMEARSCDELVDAFALVVALATPQPSVDVQAPARTTASAFAPRPLPKAHPPARPSAEPLRPAPASDETSSGTRVAPGDASSEVHVERSTSELERPPPIAGEKPAVWFQVGAGPLLNPTLTPTALLGGGLFIEVGSARPGMQGASGRLVLDWSSSSVDRLFHAPATSMALFDWKTVRLEGCPVAFNLGEAFSLRPCVSASLGLLSTSGPAADPLDLAMVSASARVRARWQPRGARVYLELETALDVVINDVELTGAGVPIDPTPSTRLESTTAVWLGLLLF